MTLTVGGSTSCLWTFQRHLTSLHQSHPKCSLGGSGWPTSTIQQAYYGILLSADPATPPIKLGSSKITSVHFTDVRYWHKADID